jgi:steroid delta-isomerase-like uncharacterized protein
MSVARRYFEELFNAGQLAVADEILDPDVSFVGPITPDGIHGLDAFKRFAEAWYRGFPDRHFELIEEWVDGDRIATLFGITGTHDGEFLGQAATGSTIDVRVMNFFRIEGGKIRAIQAFFNPLDLLYPVGLAPTRNALWLGR